MRTMQLTDYGLGLRIDSVPASPFNRVEEIRELLHQHGVIVFNDVWMANEDYCAFAGQFGSRETVFPSAHQDPGYPEIRLQSNVAGVGVAGGGEYWHADGPLTEVPTALTFLHCESAPDIGGGTLFADMRRGFATLSAPTRAQVRELRGSYPCREIAQREMAAAGIPQQEREEKLAGLWNLTHPIVRQHPVTGQDALYLNQQWMTAIEGMGSEGDELLAKLYQVATAEGNVYEHHWAAGDLVIWDNATVMHRALPPEAGEKITRRITVAGADYA